MEVSVRFVWSFSTKFLQRAGLAASTWAGVAAESWPSQRRVANSAINIGSSASQWYAYWGAEPADGDEVIAVGVLWHRSALKTSKRPSKSPIVSATVQSSGSRSATSTRPENWVSAGGGDADSPTCKIIFVCTTLATSASR